MRPLYFCDWNRIFVEKRVSFDSAWKVIPAKNTNFLFTKQIRYFHICLKLEQDQENWQILKFFKYLIFYTVSDSNLCADSENIIGFCISLTVFEISRFKWLKSDFLWICEKTAKIWTKWTLNSESASLFTPENVLKTWKNANFQFWKR